MNFQDIRLPVFMEAFAVGSPIFAACSALTMSGREVRRLESEAARQKYILKNCRLSYLQFEQFNNFFRARRGSCFSFRFRDYADYKVEKQVIAVGDGRAKQFLLVKLYDDQVSPYCRRITKPVVGTVKIYLDNVLIDADINYLEGIISLKEPLIQGQTLSADFIFDLMVRFSANSFSYNYCSDGSVELENIRLLSKLVI